MQKTYIPDTNVFIHDPGAIHAFGDNKVIILTKVLAELARLRSIDGPGHSCREVLRLIDAQRTNPGSLQKGFATSGGGTASVFTCRIQTADLPTGYELDGDSVILLMVSEYRKINPNETVIFVTKDGPARIQADLMGIPVQDYENTKVIPVDRLPGTPLVIPVADDFVDLLYRAEDHKLPFGDTNGFLAQHYRSQLAHNTCCLFQGSKKHGLAIWSEVQQTFVAVDKPERRRLKSTQANPTHPPFYPRNNEQCFAHDLVVNPDIPLVTVAGKAGTGKSLIVFMAAASLLLEQKYEKLVVVRPMCNLGEDMGFLPGTKEEKYAPWAGPAYECLEVAFRGRKGSSLSDCLEDGRVELRPMTYERGRSYWHQLVIVDETQNIKSETVKAIGTRVGEGSKMVFVGDYLQVDNVDLDSQSNGFSHLVWRMAGHILCGNIRLVVPERSLLAEALANRL